MTKQQALQLIKSALDNSIAVGGFSNMQDVSVLIQAYQIISTEILTENKNKLDNNGK
jgi:hypothetical protein